MKQESTSNSISSNDDVDVVLTTAEMTEDIVEDFARQLDQVVRIQDMMVEEFQEVREQQQLDDSDQDDEKVIFGYQQLPQDDVDNGFDQLASDDDEEKQDEVNQASIKESLKLEVAASDQLKPETSDLIKSIMSNIRLSDEAIPASHTQIKAKTKIFALLIEYTFYHTNNFILIKMPKETAKRTKTTKVAADDKKKRTKKDPNAPKRGLSAYMFFSQDQRATVKEENPEATFGQIGKILGDKWKNMSDEQKKPYVKKAEADKKRYEDEKAAQ
ncbi:hypothetical protein [Parasitella parasitica]|uniref:HMG box domain-containing protein n=1 Tax=Parasitella parasitica TaxID=35722 RepID=A0A0B7NA31_9FUNG|nr:hypothetical protein [Parasitella parasitica]